MCVYGDNRQHKNGRTSKQQQRSIQQSGRWHTGDLRFNHLQAAGWLQPFQSMLVRFVHMDTLDIVRTTSLETCCRRSRTTKAPLIAPPCTKKMDRSMRVCMRARGRDNTPIEELRDRHGLTSCCVTSVSVLFYLFFSSVEFVSLAHFTSKHIRLRQCP